MRSCFHCIDYARARTPLNALCTVNRPTHGTLRHDTLLFRTRLSSHFFLGRIKLQLLIILTTLSPLSFLSLHSTISINSQATHVHPRNVERLVAIITFFFQCTLARQRASILSLFFQHTHYSSYHLPLAAESRHCLN